MDPNQQFNADAPTFQPGGQGQYPGQSYQQGYPPQQGYPQGYYAYQGYYQPDGYQQGYQEGYGYPQQSGQTYSAQSAHAQSEHAGHAQVGSQSHGYRNAGYHAQDGYGYQQQYHTQQANGRPQRAEQPKKSTDSRPADKTGVKAQAKPQAKVASNKPTPTTKSPAVQGTPRKEVATPAPVPAPVRAPVAKKEESNDAAEDWDTTNDVENEVEKKIEIEVSVDPVEELKGDIEALDLNEDDEPKILEAGKFGKLREPDPRPHLNVVFIGHVDAGKSTTCGNILYLTGQVDSRTIEKYEREAKEKNRDTWFFAFITDVNEEERQKGKTVEVGRATFDLEKTRFTILDAPGHKSFVPNMIGGAAQADIAVLIISARKGEFETGFERGGQTREHAMLAKTLGVSQLIVAINKMDDPTCNWSEDRYREIEKKLTPFLRGCGYNPATDITFVPISGLSGQNLKIPANDPSVKNAAEAAWWPSTKPTLFQILDNLTPPERNEKDPLRIPLLEGFRDQGVMASGKVEAGTVVAGQLAILMPKRAKVKILGVQINDEDVSYAKPGENVTLRVAGVEETDIGKGMVLCPFNNPCPVVTTFKAQVMIVELLEHRPLITAGYSCIIHAHTSCEEVQLVRLLESVDKATKRKKINPQFVKGNSMVICEMQMAVPICMEPFSERPQLGRFTLRDEGKTIAIGKLLEVLS